MSFEVWSFHPAASASDSQTPTSFFGATTIQALSQDISAETYSLPLQSINATGRRSWKTTGTKGETVWPPNLEIALLKGLELYQGVIGNTVCDGRHPKRNRFIADYIKRITNTERTPKQVSSRIQVLKVRCEDPWILSLINPPSGKPSIPPSTTLPYPPSLPGPPKNPYPIMDPNYASSSDLNSSPTGDPLRGSSDTQGSSPPVRGYFPPTFSVEIFLEKTLSSSFIPVVSLAAPSNSNPLKIRLAWPGFSSASTAASCDHLSGAGPMIQLSSPCPLFTHSQLCVFVDGCDVPIYTEVITFLCTSSSLEAVGQWTYLMPLVPGFWSNVGTCIDPTRYSVEQHIMPLGPFASATGPDTSDAKLGPAGGITVYYKFSLPRTEPPALRFHNPCSSIQTHGDHHRDRVSEAMLLEPHRRSNRIPTLEPSVLPPHSPPFDFPGTHEEHRPISLTHQIWRSQY
ncbi:hypothetical protein FPV67DRAFT_896799 [Lyophyllum atratum]|nr:hypothetical protein FPV67DRAFT_896799 [Lyophyllum atratum]